MLVIRDWRCNNWKRQVSTKNMSYNVKAKLYMYENNYEVIGGLLFLLGTSAKQVKIILPTIPYNTLPPLGQ